MITQIYSQGLTIKIFDMDVHINNDIIMYI